MGAVSWKFHVSLVVKVNLPYTPKLLAALEYPYRLHICNASELSGIIIVTSLGTLYTRLVLACRQMHTAVWPCKW